MKTPLNVMHWPVPGTITTAEDEIGALMSQELLKEIDMAIMQELEASAIIERQKQEATLREEHPALMEAWEEYQVLLKLIQAGQLMKQQ